MAVNYKIEERRVVPNWRDFKRTVKLKELSISGTAPLVKFDLTKRIEDWNEGHSIGTAAELVNGSFIAEIFGLKEVKDATRYIMDHSDKSSNVLLDIAKAINDYRPGVKGSNELNLIELEVDSLEGFQTHLENQTINRVLNLTRNRSKNELRNPIIWVDLARLYTFFGLKKKAERAMLIALQLAPDNRYVLRSATRMFIHFEQHEKALHYLRKSDATKNDPWLVSAHIATSSIIDRYSPYIKSGIKLANSSEFSDFEITELASSLGTLEYNDGSFKKAKKFLQQSMLSPNDNSLAQMEWLSQKEKSFAFDASSHKNVSNPFEAFAFDTYQIGNWTETINNCVYWFLDIPYSKRPILLGSYVASMFLKDYNAAVTLCKAGLKANPYDPILLNNITYSLLMSDKMTEAETYLTSLRRIKLDSLPAEDVIPIQATLGLAAFKSGDITKGERFYEQAITNAHESKNEDLEKLAFLIYFRELILNNRTQKILEYAATVERLDPAKSKDVQQIKNETIELYERHKSTTK